MTELEWLQQYYLECCNGDWEHTYGVTIGTLDNPGWEIEIILTDTTLENMFSNKLKIERTEDDWLLCTIDKEKFVGYGGPKNLSEMIGIFRQWVEECDSKLNKEVNI